MKKLLAVTALALASTAFAQDSNYGSSNTGSNFGGMLNIQNQDARPADDQRHMIEFNAQSVPSLVYAFEKTKTKGTDSDNDSDTNLSMNYAYTIHPNIQVGGAFNFFNGVFSNNDTERFDVSAKGWFNFKGGDLQNSAYLALSLGAGYAHTFGANGGRDDLILSSVSLGKRFSMERFGVKALTWTPEIALVNENSTANTSFDYRQATEFRVLQFSVIW